MSALSLQLRPDATVERPAPDQITITTNASGPVPFRNLTPGAVQAFAHLTNGGATEHHLTEIILESDDGMAVMRFQAHLMRLHQNALLQQTLVVEDTPLATLTPMTRHIRLEKRVKADATYRLSRFALLRRDGEKLILETPLGHARITLHDGRAAMLLGLLAQPHTVTSAHEALPSLDTATISEFFNLLLNAQAIAPLGDDQRLPEESDTSLALWDFHDALFHNRSRQGYHNYPYGGTFRGPAIMPPLPALKPDLPTEIIPLPKPDIAALREQDRPFTDVLESRTSLRTQGEQPLTLAQLGEFLYRSARVVRTMRAAENGMEHMQRPSPSGGAIHELEIYPVIDRCEGIESGLYYYNPHAHQLHRISARTPLVEALLVRAWFTANRESRPQVYFGITARFQRLQWKYESITYSIILRNVGALYQTMYLVATAMGLAPCGLGGGDSHLFSLAAGLSYFEESTVGDFILGSLPAGSDA